MKAYLLILMTSFLACASFAENSEIEKIKETAVQNWLLIQADRASDQLLQEKFQKSDEAKLQQMPVNQVMGLMGLPELAAPMDNCNTDPSNPVQKNCWQKCGQDGWGVEYCVGQCGVSASEGSEACWDKCGKDGWGLDYCSGQCQVQLESGSLKCWDKCGKDGWGVDYCSSKCGTSKGLASEACWNKCGKDGWGVDYCVGQCKVDSVQGSSACWDKCSSDGWGVSYCSSKCGVGN